MHPFLYKYNDVLFIAVIVLIALYRINHSELGFSTQYLYQHIFLGLFIGSLFLLSLPLLQTGLDGMERIDHKIFLEKPETDISYNLSFLLEKIVIVFFIPIIEQVFFTGLVLQSLLKKAHPILAIYIVGLIYTLTGFDLTFGSFGLGIGAGLLFKLTGTLYASILFHISCVVGGELLVNVYPKLMLILGFLF